jgi:ribonuclease E
MSSGGWGPGASGRGPSRSGRWEDPDDKPARSSGRRGPPAGRDPREPRGGREPRDLRDPRDMRDMRPPRDGRDPGQSMGGTRTPDRPHSRHGGVGDDWGGSPRGRREVDADDWRPASRSGGRSGDRGQMGGARPRDEWGEAPRGGRGQATREPERSRGGARGSPREEAWAPSGTRGGWDEAPPRRSSRDADASGSRSRRPVQQPRGGGLWGDDGGRPLGGDPRAARRGATRDGSARGRTARGSWDAFEEDEQPSTGKTILIGLGSVALAVVLGAGAAFGYWKVSTPKPPAAASTSTPVSSPATTGTPSKTPATTPSTTPHANVGSGVRTVRIGSDGREM